MKKIMVVLVICLITVLTMRGLSAYGMHERGYPAIGGEILIPVIPIVGATIIHDERSYGIRLSTKVRRKSNEN